MSHKTMKVNNNGQKQLKGKPCTHGFEGVRGGRPSKVGMSWKRKERRKLPMQGRGEQVGETWEQVNGTNKEGRKSELITMRGGRNWCQNLVGQ